jgi:hypothetical protein
MRWQQNPERNPPVTQPPDSAADTDHREMARRVAFLLAKEDAQVRKEQAPPVAKPSKKATA